MEYFDREIVINLIQTLVIVVTALALFFGLRSRIVGLATRANLPQLALKPVGLAFRYGILAIATLVIFARWGFPINTIVALLGTILGLVAIGFVAVWSVLSSFLCTFLLILFRPFSIGDDLEIPSDNVKGRVTDLSLVFTTLEVGDGETVLVPNNTFFQRIFKRREGRSTVQLEVQLGQERPKC